MHSIMSNNTWILSDLPPGCKSICCRWIFRKKLKSDGTLDKYKARLVAKGFTQLKYIDYFDTFALVARMTSIRLLIALAAIHSLVIHQMDVKTAFLNGDLDEEVYMKQPDGFLVLGQEHKVCKLLKSLYGLKQAPKQWNEKFRRVMISNGYSINGGDICIFSKFQEKSGVIICLYVDDMLIFGTDIERVKETKNFLASQFEMKDLGEADVILGIKIIRSANGLTLTQSSYIEKVLKRFGHFDDKPAPTPFDPSIKLMRNSSDVLDQLTYSHIVGSLMYAMHCTRPDIGYAVGTLSKFTSNPGVEHWNALIRVLRYLKGTINVGLHYSTFPIVLEGYSDATWNSDPNDSKSITAWIFTLAGAAISLK